MDIRCRKTECLYNCKFTCKAKDILVNDKMICSTFEKTDKIEPDTTRTIFEKTPEYAPMRDSKTLCIGCKAHCMFNDKGLCEANGITINAIDEKPYCVTYVRE